MICPAWRFGIPLPHSLKERLGMLVGLLVGQLLVLWIFQVANTGATNI